MKSSISDNIVDNKQLSTKTIVSQFTINLPTHYQQQYHKNTSYIFTKLRLISAPIVYWETTVTEKYNTIYWDAIVTSISNTVYWDNVAIL